MFGLSEAHYNIVKAKCRECKEEIKNAIAKGEVYDRVAAQIIDKHHASVKVLINRTAFVWLCGYLEGRFGANFDYE